MIFGKKTKQLKQKIDTIENSVVQSFSKVRQDMDTTNAWLNYYYQRSLYFEDQLNKLTAKSDKLSSEIVKNTDSLDEHSQLMKELASNVTQIIQDFSSMKKDSHSDRFNFHIENISKELLKLGHKVEQLSFLSSKFDSLKQEVSEHLSEPHTSAVFEKRIDDINERLKSIIIKKSPKQKLIQKVTKNSHDYIKAMVISYIRKYGKISAYQLREMVVEEQNLTSKSTFYRILEEIEGLDEVSIIHQGKEKIYLSKLKKSA
jgi:archaellum component FlaC